MGMSRRVTEFGLVKPSDAPASCNQQKKAPLASNSWVYQPFWNLLRHLEMFHLNCDAHPKSAGAGTAAQPPNSERV